MHHLEISTGGGAATHLSSPAASLPIFWSSSFNTWSAGASKVPTTTKDLEYSIGDCGYGLRTMTLTC